MKIPVEEHILTAKAEPFRLLDKLLKEGFLFSKGYSDVGLEH